MAMRGDLFQRKVRVSKNKFKNISSFNKWDFMNDNLASKILTFNINCVNLKLDLYSIWDEKKSFILKVAVTDEIFWKE